MSYEYLTKEFIQSHEFIFDEFVPEHTVKSFRLTQGAKLPPTEEELQIELRKKLASIVASEFLKYSVLEERCNIHETTIRKYIKGTRNITFYNLAKLCIGANLPIEKTEEIFKLYGHVLSPDKYRLDAIIWDAIKCKDDIYTFYKTLRECGLSKVADKMECFN